MTTLHCPPSTMLGDGTQPEEAASTLKWPNNIEALWRCEALLVAENGKSRVRQQD